MSLVLSNALQVNINEIALQMAHRLVTLTILLSKNSVTLQCDTLHQVHSKVCNCGHNLWCNPPDIIL